MEPSTLLQRSPRRSPKAVLVAYWQGLWVSELVDLRWDRTPSIHPIVGDELRALRRLQREQEPKSPFVFTSERGAPFTTAGFARIIERAGDEANLGFRLTLTCYATPAVMR